MAEYEKGGDDRVPGILLSINHKTYFIEGDPEAIMNKILDFLRGEGLIEEGNLINPDELFRFTREEIEELLGGGVVITRGKR
jgi:hypothetical protein